MKQLCILLVRFYQKFLSPLKGGPCCRFYPTCSAYAIEAFTKRGFFVGFALTVWRILRCNPFCPGGYDPVPERRPRSKTGPSRRRGGSKEMRPLGRPYDARTGSQTDRPDDTTPNLEREDTAPETGTEPVRDADGDAGDTRENLPK